MLDIAAQLSQTPPRKILLIGREHIGDIVNTTGALSAIRARFPEAHITLDVGINTVSLLEGTPDVDRIWSRPRRQGLLGKIRAVQRIRQEHFNLAIILDDSNEHIRIVTLGGVPLRVGIFKSKHAHLYSAFVEHSEHEHDVFDPQSRLLELLGINNADLSPRLPVNDAHRHAAAVALRQVGWDGKQSIVGLFVGASDFRKKWPTERFDAVANKLRSGWAVFVCGPGEEAEASAFGHPILVTKSPLVLAAAIEMMAAFVSNDTGPAHISAAVRTPTVVLYGPTDPHQFHPYGSDHQLLFHAVGCSHYAGHCISGSVCDRRCMTSISVDEVVDAVQRSSPRPGP